jgi:hypothetical protein
VACRGFSSRGGRLCAAAVFLITGVVLPVQGSPAAPKGAQIVEEIVNARARLNRLKSYRVTLTLAPGTVVLLRQGAHVVVEVVNPDRYRSVFTMGTTGSAESITVGRQTRSRTSSPRARGAWQCQAHDPPVSDLLPVLPAKASEVVAPSFLGQALTGGVTARGFQYQKKEGRRLSTYRLYTLAGRGFPSRLEAFSAQGKPDITADYYDFDMPIKIELPPCG